MRSIGLLLGASLLLAACAALPRQPVPQADYAAATIPHIPGARYWADEPPANLTDIAAEIARQREESGIGEDVVLLALSGGGDNGAFGAGILNAWSKLGTRPEFTMVTGVSTGALSAPFAFLGPEYDDALREVYGGFPPDRIFKLRGLLNILPRASVADTRPLENLIAQFADEKMLAAVAREHKRGRRLLVQSTNLDAERPVIWDLGAIASSGAPNALEVFRKALLASASIPVFFPPVLFDVEARGTHYDELHVDGSVVSTATVLSDWQIDVGKVAEKTLNKNRKSLKIYVIRNGTVGPEFKHVDYKLLGIAGRSLGTLLKAQGVNSLLPAYTTAELRDGAFYATWIGADFEQEYPGPFDPAYMSALYKYGFDLMSEGKAWFDRPPVLMTAAEREQSLRPMSRAPQPAATN